MGRAGRRPERRNRKLGTADWNWRDRPDARPRFDVPWPTWEERAPGERWTPASIEQHEVHGQTIAVAVEELRSGCTHVCSRADACGVLGCLPAADVAGIELVVLRQPTRKEDVLRPAWGRIHWCVEFRGYTGPAIVLDAVDFGHARLRWSRSLGPERERELSRMRQLEFAVTETRREYEISLTPKHVRRWLLTRTIPHEVGHWVDHRQRTRDPLDAADQRPQREREQYADRYADRMQPAVERHLEELDASRRSVADHGRGMLTGITPASASMVDDLLAERRSEAAREDRE